jgi:DNA-directed RNA polymerase specialized sigma24 family protein
VTSEDVSPVSTTTSPLAALEQRDLAALLRTALQALPQSLRMAVLLRDIQELSYQEIAERLRLPEGTVKSRINRGRRELARQIQRLRDEADGRVATIRSNAAGLPPAHHQAGSLRRRGTGVSE